MKKSTMLMLILPMLMLFSCAKEAIDPEEVEYSEVKFEIDKFIDPLVIPGGRLGSVLEKESIEAIESWEHQFSATDTFEIWFNPGGYHVTGTYDDLASVSIRVPYGTYTQVALLSDDSNPQTPTKRSTFIYSASADNVAIDSPTLTLTLTAHTNFGLMLLDPTNVASVDTEVYQSQGWYYFYHTESFSFNVTTEDTGAILPFAVDHVIGGSTYIGRVPLAGMAGLMLDMSQIFTTESEYEYILR